MPAMHPSITDKLSQFGYSHLPEHLQAISRPYHDLAHDMATRLQNTKAGAQLTISLQKLLESKDEAVRAAVAL